MRWLLLAIFFFALPLTAQTVLQNQADHAQNYLDQTLLKIADSWKMMKYHFSEGNKKLKESAKEKLPELPEKLKPGK
ncbi:MAG: hypothetical protein IKB25_08865 [Lentisphaeria bacterium]|nr:hypothetical protein [Lentisphaeria bacterium]